MAIDPEMAARFTDIEVQVAMISTRIDAVGATIDKVDGNLVGLSAAICELVHVQQLALVEMKTELAASRKLFLPPGVAGVG